MKKINKSSKSLITGLFVLVAVVLTSVPSVSLADEHEKQKSNHGFSSAWNRFIDFFGTKVNADSTTKTTTSSTPVISSITAPTVLRVGETGTWTVKASDPQNKPLSYTVDWGDSTSKSSSMLRATFVQTSTFQHAYDKEGEYTVKFTVSNDSEQAITSTVSVNVGEDSEENGPVIANLTAKSFKPRQATIGWTTDTRATSLVWYNTASPVDTSRNPNISRPAKIWNHKINLSRLEPGTKYYVVVGGANDSGNTTKSSEISFTTPEILNNTPVIIKLDGPSSIVAGETETVTVKAYDPKNSSLSYSVDWGDTPFTTALMVSPKPFIQTTTFSHIYDKSGIYTATFTVQNEAGYKTSSSMKIRVVDIDTNNS